MTHPTFTIQDIRDLGPCYDPVTGADQYGKIIHPGGFLPEGWSGTALDVLRVEACPAKDRLWVVLHAGWIDARTARLFAVWCARQALAHADNHDPRSVAACDVAERYANGDATEDELMAAHIAAGEATGAWAWDVAWDASWNAVDKAAERVAAAVRVAAAASARNVDVTAASARDSGWTAADTAAWWDARDAARDAQIRHLIEMIEEQS